MQLSGDARKDYCFWKFREIPRKTSLVDLFQIVGAVQSTTYNLTENWLHRKWMVPVSVTRIFETVSVAKPFFSKVTGEITAFYNSAENSITCIGMF